MNKIETALIKSLQQTSIEFGEDELAFLALTTKIELPLRDRWAYVLYRKLSRSNLIVSREWKRIDLAVLKDKIPLALIQLKAMYTFNAVYERGFYKRAIKCLKEDVRKARKLATQDTTVYTVLLATHPMSEIGTELENVVKFRSGMNGALRDLGRPEAVAKAARRRVKKGFGDQNIVKSGVLHGGSAFGVDTNVMYWIIRAR